MAPAPSRPTAGATEKPVDDDHEIGRRLRQDERDDGHARAERVDEVAGDPRDRRHGRRRVEALLVRRERVDEVPELLLDRADAQVDLRRGLEREGLLELAERDLDGSCQPYNYVVCFPMN